MLWKKNKVISVLYGLLIYFLLFFSGYTVTHNNIDLRPYGLGSFKVYKESKETTFTRIRLHNWKLANGSLSCFTLSNLHHLRWFRGKYFVYVVLKPLHYFVIYILISDLQRFTPPFQICFTHNLQKLLFTVAWVLMCYLSYLLT